MNCLREIDMIDPIFGECSQLVDAASSDESKARLRQQTDDAVAAGVFGIPTMLGGDGLFWGYDDLHFLELFLAGKDPLDSSQASKWQAGVVVPSAVRRRFRT